jgi:hypothetical protein
MFIDADESALLIILAVSEGRTPELIQASSAHITLVSHPKYNFLLLPGDPPLE